MCVYVSMSYDTELDQRIGSHLFDVDAGEYA